MHDGRVGFDGDALALPQDGAETDAGKVVGDEFRGGFLVFVGGHGDLDAFCLQVVQQLEDAGIGTAQVGVVDVVIRDELGADAEHILLRFLAFGKGAFEEFVDAVAHHEGVGRGVVRGVAQGLQGVVGALCQVGDGVQQSAVQIEYNELLHCR